MPTPSPRPTATVDCDDTVQFIADVTIPNSTAMTPGRDFAKTWRLRNSGNCDWATAFEAVFIDGASMGAPAGIPLAGTVPSDGTIDISVEMTAPTTNGSYRGNHRMRNAGTTLFGSPFYVQIVAGPTPAPTLDVHRTGTVTIDNGGSIDLEGGNSAGDPNRDVWVHYVSDSERYLEPTNGTLLKVMSGAPSYETCKDASLNSGAVSFADFCSQTDFCYQTSSGRYGRFQIEKIGGDSVGFDFRTWD